MSITTIKYGDLVRIVTEIHRALQRLKNRRAQGAVHITSRLILGIVD